MLSKRTLLSLAIALIFALGTVQVSIAKNPHHNNGHTLLGGKLNQDGKHEVGKIKNNSVTAEVKGKKVLNMSDGNLPVQKVKSTRKMVDEQINGIRLAANGEIQIAQADVYYGYCFTDGIDEYCYWYPATDVVVTDTWIVYSP